MRWCLSTFEDDIPAPGRWWPSQRETVPLPGPRQSGLMDAIYESARTGRCVVEQADIDEAEDLPDRFTCGYGRLPFLLVLGE